VDKCDDLIEDCNKVVANDNEENKEYENEV